MKRVIFVSGPSGISKTRIKEKLENLAPALGILFERVIAFTSRKMRQNEREGDPWFFRTSGQIEKMNAYDCVIVNHQGEESVEWGAPREFPTGEAARVFEQVLRVYRG